MTLLMLLGLPACGSSGAGGAAGSSGAGDAKGSAPMVQRVGPRDSGELVKLAVGDRLVVSLEAVPQSAWRLLGYPGRILDLVKRRSDLSRYEFEAKAAGRGSVTLRLGAECRPPLLRPCRMGRDGDADSGRPPLFGRAYRLDVRVEPNG